MAPVIASWSDKFIAGFRASPGKSFTVSGLAVILVVLWCRFLFWGRTPAAASGATAQVDSPSAVSSVPWASRPGGEDVSLQQWARQSIRPLIRNPFAIPLDEYPRDGASVAVGGTSQTGYWDLVEKSLSSRADQQEQRQILIDNVRIASASLKLQSTILGAHRGAMVNGNMVREGDTVAGFRVVSIEARQVVVEREGIKLALLMD
ncbi:MAG: general secretion pathway protein GspB [Tepidisphaeraceae bacterium]|jgi:hypothetical protein